MNGNITIRCQQCLNRDLQQEARPLLSAFRIIKYLTCGGVVFLVDHIEVAKRVFEEPPGEPPMNVSGQYQFKSISIENFEILIHEMVKAKETQDWYSQLQDSDPLFDNDTFKKKKPALAVEHLNSHLLRAYMLAGNKHPAKAFPHLFHEDSPEGVLTYEWKVSVTSVLNVLKMGGLKKKAYDSKLLFWIDILFVNQLSKNIPVELAIAQQFYIKCRWHIVAGSLSLLNRGWCIWELGLRAHSGQGILLIGKLEKKRAGYDYFHEMELFDRGDRASIEIGLKRVFGWGNDGKDRINAAIEGICERAHGKVGDREPALSPGLPPGQEKA